ncbi:hypothetical protein M0R45_028313 [Rubus argutus]|uniref:Uncharacterized protein n=1 Tax=Rubus argutus TaxID=59490 RepID=A0AAW1W5A8_RUBAR
MAETPAANPTTGSIISSLADQQFVLQIAQSSTSTAHDEPANKSSAPAPAPYHGTLNLKVTEPILLHIHSLPPTSTPAPPGISTELTPIPPKGQASSNPQLNDTLKGKHQKALTRVGSLANLLPTGTVLAFQAITPSLSYNGSCHVFNKYLVALVMLACSLVCFLSSFSDSFEHNNKVFYGVATFKGLAVFNYQDHEAEDEIIKKKAENLKIKIQTDFLHAFVSVFVFLIFACSSLEVQSCYFPATIRDDLEYSMVIYLPLLAGILSSFLFTFVPTERKGIGYTSTART